MPCIPPIDLDVHLDDVYLGRYAPPNSRAVWPLTGNILDPVGLLCTCCSWRRGGQGLAQAYV